MKIALSELADRFGLSLKGKDREVTGMNTLSDAGPDELGFLSNPKYASALATTRAAAVILDPEHAQDVDNALIGDNPYLAVARIASLFHAPQGSFAGQSEMAFVHPEARVAEDAVVYPFVYIGAGASVGSGTQIFPHCYVGERCTVGKGCLIYPGVTLMADVHLADGVTLQPGAVVGSDGFGYAPSPEGLVKVPQMGPVEIGPQVEIGANTTVDRGSLGKTTIGAGTKIDNLVQVAHNVSIGAHSVIVSQVGISGSVSIGSGVQIGGQAGMIGHLSIGDGARVGAQSGVINDVPAGKEVIGAPAGDPGRFFRSMAVFNKLPELSKRVRSLEKKLQVVESKGE